MAIETSATTDLGNRIDAIRADFPALHQEVNGKPLVYLDNAATTQRPQSVIDAISGFYTHDNSNVHRGVHALSQRATDRFDAVRTALTSFLGAADEREIIFTRGTTDGVNLVAQTWGRTNIGAGDEILLSAIEHHANIVPWQMLAQQVGATINVIPMHDNGALDLDQLPDLVTDRTKLIGCVHVSNALGTVNPVAEICAFARERGITTLIDGAQATLHVPIDVQAIGCDFYAMSAHKMTGPTGVGALYGRLELLEAMPPYQGGGDMIASVSWDGTTYNEVPHKFEAGTPPIASVIGFGAALQYVRDLGVANIAAYEAELLGYLQQQVAARTKTVTEIGTAPGKASIFSFRMANAAPLDIGMVLDQQGVAVRAGHHCAQPVMTRLGIAGTARASLAFYNNRDEIDRFVDALCVVEELFA